jgi:hypothetical protein
VILVNSRKNGLGFVRPGMLHSGQYGLDTISFKVIFAFADPPAVIVDSSRFRPLRSLKCSFAPTGVLMNTNTWVVLSGTVVPVLSRGQDLIFLKQESNHENSIPLRAFEPKLHCF